METKTEKEMATANLPKLQRRKYKYLRLLCTFICAMCLALNVSTDVFAAEAERSITPTEWFQMFLTNEKTYSEEKQNYQYTPEELLALYLTVQGEAGAESLRGKMAVAAVALNRYFGDNAFHYNNIVETVYAPNQFAPARGYSVEWFINNNPEVIVAVNLAIQGFDPTAEAFPDEGALFFHADWRNGYYGCNKIMGEGKNKRIVIDRQSFNQ